ncbi:Prephenate dehydratase [Lipomyces arxii]|uniref:Prephenate dehydratase n=1 Tax=Lipomyces arxii TaxID=56418 RepID=UPI0034D00B35
MTNSKMVAFLGPIGTYSYKAVSQYFDGRDEHRYIPYATIAACFEALANSEVDFAVVPFSNSSNGPVKFTFKLLRESSPRPTIIGDTLVSVEHYVLASPAALHNIETHGESSIKVVYSHPQVWGQCVKYLNEHFDSAECVDCDSTAYAATLAAKNEFSVAIASLSAADDTDVAVYASRIQDIADNCTRFIVIQRSSAETVPTPLDRSVADEIATARL